jgi:hypothetical protein
MSLLLFSSHIVFSTRHCFLVLCSTIYLVVASLVALHTAWNTHQNLKHATGKITNNTHSNKYITRYSKMDGNYGTREHIKVGNKVQRSDATTQ